MKTIILSLFLLFAYLCAFAQESDAIVGKWYTEDKGAKIEIFKQNGKFYGKIVWLKEPNRNGKPKMDDFNPDAKLKTRPLIGLQMLKDFVFDSKGKWKSGEIYDPKNGKTYSCKITMVSWDKLNVRGYIGISLIGRTSEWTRAKD